MGKGREGRCPSWPCGQFIPAYLGNNESLGFLAVGEVVPESLLLLTRFWTCRQADPWGVVTSGDRFHHENAFGDPGSGFIC